MRRGGKEVLSSSPSFSLYPPFPSGRRPLLLPSPLSFPQSIFQRPSSPSVCLTRPARCSGPSGRARADKHTFSPAPHLSACLCVSGREASFPESILRVFLHNNLFTRIKTDGERKEIEANTRELGRKEATSLLPPTFPPPSEI